MSLGFDISLSPIRSKKRHAGDDVDMPQHKRQRSLPLISSPRSYERKYPPLSMNDTLIMNRRTGQLVSEHGQAHVFLDEEILKVHNVLEKTPLYTPSKKQVQTIFSFLPSTKQEVFIEYTENKKAIIQQQATRGCTAAAAAMLIEDNGGECSYKTLRRRNLANTDQICRDIEEAGLNPLALKIGKSLEALQAAIEERGSAIVSISDPKCGGHVLVVDEINPISCRLRDPYHGWEISVLRAALETRLDGDIVQISNEA